ncbi:hypothetical protein QA601_14575 [Chitinispirillales bacterium ANBcel5]|uniref:hypothetical protein n=1 Tax=Cellulosispirillum alkaliphilum TaxID=3039283 RepID=UPI002A51D25A|nr:hypothetical protein [Chitinispirillales bacterium ANBcel5]
MTQNSTPERKLSTDQPKNVHEDYYDKNKDELRKRFPKRKTDDKLAYLKQVVLVFGSAIIIISSLIKKIPLHKSFTEVAGWDVTILCCVINLTFAYAFGFAAVVDDWWFFFPDLFTGIIWQIGDGQMILGDVLFYPLAVIMGHVTVIVTVRMNNPISNAKLDALLKTAFYMILFTITFFGIIFGSTVFKGMILWLYLPFGLAGLFFYKHYNAFQLWVTTIVFVTVEILWDVVARVQGIWIFPDSSTHPGLYFNEIELFSILNFPVIWQPEMTQMSFISGLICLVFFHLARMLLNKPDLAERPGP